MTVLKGLLSFILFLPGLMRELRRAARMYRRAVAEGWAKEHHELATQIEKSTSDEERAKLASSLADLMRKSR